MNRSGKINKANRLRKRLFVQYKRQEYATAARLGEALLLEHITSTNRPIYADDLYNTALACSAAGLVDRAIELYTESIQHTFANNGADLLVATRLTNLAALLSSYDQHESACRIFIQALQIRKELLPHDHLELGDSLYNMGRALIRAERYREALPALNSAMHIYTRGGGENLFNCLHVLAHTHELLEEYEHALPFAEAAWRGLALIDVDKHQRAGYYLAQLYEQCGRNSEACELLLSAMEWLGQSLGYTHSSYINLGTKTASMLAKLGTYQQAKEILIRLHKLIGKMVGSNNLTYSNCLRNLITIHQLLEEWDEADALLRELDEMHTFKDFSESSQLEP